MMWKPLKWNFCCSELTAIKGPGARIDHGSTTDLRRPGLTRGSRVSWGPGVPWFLENLRIQRVLELWNFNWLCKHIKKIRSCQDFKWLQRDSNLRHSVCKRTLNHLAKLTKWLSCVVNVYLYGAFECVFLSCNIRLLE